MASDRLFLVLTETAPMGTVSSTSRSISPGHLPGCAANARPAARAGTTADSAVEAAHTPVANPLLRFRQPCPLWSSVVPLPVRKLPLRENVSHSATWVGASTCPRRL